MHSQPLRTCRELLAHAAGQLAAISESPQLDAELLLSRALDRPRSHLRAWPDKQPDDEQRAQFETLLARRLHGEPMAYILGEREFWSMNLHVNADTLIPRPDTEILVEAALQRIPNDRPCRVIDMGTGSGAIALALKQERPLADIWATDASAAALQAARNNAARLGLDVGFLEGCWWSPLQGMQFDVIVSNPPYIAATDPHLQSGDLRFEPQTALAAGVDGLDDLRVLIEGASAHLAPGGWLLLEHGHDQADAVRELLLAAALEQPGSRRDLAGHVRVSHAQRPAT